MNRMEGSKKFLQMDHANCNESDLVWDIPIESRYRCRDRHHLLDVD